MGEKSNNDLRRRVKILVGILLITGVFVVDLCTPLGIPDGMSYILIVILTIWTESKNFTIATATASVILTIFGYFLSPQPTNDILDIAIANRSISILFIIISAAFIVKYKSVEQVMVKQREDMEQLSKKLKENNLRLEEQVEARTKVLQEALNELESSREELSSALEHEKELSALKTRIVSMASHEFRTPLATILSSLSLISKYGEMNEKEKQYNHILKIRSAISHLTDLVEDTLTVSKLEEDKIDLSPEIIYPDTFMRQIVNEMRDLVKTGQKINYLHAGDAEIEMDKKVLKRIVINLLTNAIKFSNEGEVINISTRVEEGSFVLKVEDHGIGIPMQDQKRLFERFFRAENAFNIQGTGLGLSIVARYVELLHGTIRVDSTENVGTTFTLTFPRMLIRAAKYSLAS